MITFSQGPTWSDNVACIIYTHCTKCHNNSGIAPTSLVTYAEALAQAAGIKTQVQSKQMPPWKADRNYRHFAAEKYLSDDEINTIVRWVDSGSAEGISAHAPPPPVYAGTPEISSPDKIFAMTHYTVPDTSTDDVYRCFLLPGSFTGNPYLVGLEVIPGNSAIVHHILVFQDSTSLPDSLDAADPAPGFGGFLAMGSPGGSLIGTWAPGSGAYFFPNHMGVRIKQNARIMIQVHYPVSGAGQTDSTKVLMKLSYDSTLRNVRIQPFLNEGVDMIDGPLHIPAGAVRTFHEAYNITSDLTLLSIFPHMHLLGRSVKIYDLNAAGDSIPLINIPDWDFHWQGFYNLQRPVKLPAHTRIYGAALYDNTNANPNNPHIPPIAVNAGYSSNDEMMLTYFATTAYEPGDESIIFDTSTVIPSYLGCSYVTGMPEINFSAMKLFPNPSNSRLEVQLSDYQDTQLEIFNMMGELVYSKKLDSVESILDVQDWSAGVYQLRINHGRSYERSTFIKQ